MHTNTNIHKGKVGSDRGCFQVSPILDAECCGHSSLVSLHVKRFLTYGSWAGVNRASVFVSQVKVHVPDGLAVCQSRPISGPFGCREVVVAFFGSETIYLCGLN